MGMTDDTAAKPATTLVDRLRAKGAAPRPAPDLDRAIAAATVPDEPHKNGRLMASSAPIMLFDSTTSKEARARHALPPSLPPRGLCREAAAAYVGVSPSKFDDMVKDGRMPPPVRVDARTIWDRRRLDKAFEALAIATPRTGFAGNNDDDDINEWDSV